MYYVCIVCVLYVYCMCIVCVLYVYRLEFSLSPRGSRSVYYRLVRRSLYSKNYCPSPMKQQNPEARTGDAATGIVCKVLTGMNWETKPVHFLHRIGNRRFRE